MRGAARGAARRIDRLGELHRRRRAHAVFVAAAGLLLIWHDEHPPSRGKSPQCADSEHAAAVVTAAGRADLIESSVSRNACSCKRRPAPQEGDGTRATPARSSHDFDALAAAQRDRCRTIWAAPHLRAARALWSESGGRGGVSDLGGGGQPTAEANVASTSGSPSARTRNVAFALGGPAMPDGTKAIEGYPRPHARACVWRPSARLGDVPRSGW